MTPSNNPCFQLKRNWRCWLTAALILASIFGLTILSHGSPTLLRKPLDEFPREVDSWRGTDAPMDSRSLEILGASDLISRSYSSPSSTRSMGLFVAFFSSQRKGGAIHSPKNCLPGSGWEPLKGDIIPITLPGHVKPVDINRYIIQNGLNKQVVLYWYQSQGRIIASEYSAKICLIWDAIRRNRTDGALVRVVTPVLNGDEKGATETAVSFIQKGFPRLEESLPN